MKRVLVPIANQSEEIEAVGIIDTLRRAKIEVIVASVEPTLTIKASRDISLVADCFVKDIADQDFDLIALPGGMPGAEYLRDSKILTNLLKKQASSGKYYAAICASPAIVLLSHGLLKGLKATCHPALQSQIPANQLSNDRVVVDGHCITSQGPGTVLEFSIKLIEILLGKDKALEISTPMLIR